MKKIILIAGLALIAFFIGNICSYGQDIQVPGHPGVFYHYGKDGTDIENSTTFDQNKCVMATIQSLLTTLQARIGAQITTPTTARSVLHENEGAILDTICQILTQLNGGSGRTNTLMDLQTVTDNGNTTKNNILVKDGTGTTTAIMNKLGAVGVLNPGNGSQQLYLVSLGNGGVPGVDKCYIEYQNVDIPVMAKILFDQITADILDFQLPDENGATVATAHTLVTHTTKDAINVVNGATVAGYMGSAIMALKDPASSQLYAGATFVAGVPYLFVHSPSTTFGTLIKASAGLAAGNILTAPPYTGDIATNKQGLNVSSGALVAANNVTITYAPGYTPLNIILTAVGSGAGAALVGHEITNITDTSFKINFAAPVTGNFTFNWQAF